MKIKKHHIFLWVSLAFFTASAIYILVMCIMPYCEFKTISSGLNRNDYIRFEYAMFIEILAVFVLVFPVLLVELSGIRSTYKLLKYEPKGFVKVCYLISVILTLLAVIFQWLVFFKVIELIGDSGTIKYQERAVLLTGWPIFIISFILGSIKHNIESKSKKALE